VDGPLRDEPYLLRSKPSAARACAKDLPIPEDAPVTPATAGWSGAERRMAAAMLDVLWSTTSHLRLTEVWDFDHDQAVQVATGGIDLLVQAIRDGHRPRTEPP
jgi:hypothetical protein